MTRYTMDAAMTRRVVLIGAMVGILAMPAVGHAQETIVNGTVTDTTGGVLPGVTVRGVNAASGNSFETVTDARGAYRLAPRLGPFHGPAPPPGVGQGAPPPGPLGGQ